MNFIKFHSEKNFIISGVCLSGVCLVRSLSRQEIVFPEFVFPEFVFQEFVFQEFVTAPTLIVWVQGRVEKMPKKGSKNEEKKIFFFENKYQSVTHVSTCIFMGFSKI